MLNQISVFKNTKFANTTITFTDQNSRRLKIDDKANLTLLISK